MIESFKFDSLDRLRAYTYASGPYSNSVAMEYLANGNIHRKSDGGWYHDGNTNGAAPARPQQLRQIIGWNRNYDGYDNNGNQTIITENGNVLKKMEYTAFDLPHTVTTGTGSPETTGVSSFKYGPELQRVVSKVPDESGKTLETWHLNGEDSLGLSLEKLFRSTNGTTTTVTYRPYISAGGRTVAQIDTAENENPVRLVPMTTAGRRYFVHDHLGSVAVIFDHTGVVQERDFYDLWRRRRNPNGRFEAGFASNSDLGTRGFTMQEHRASLGMINVNGRFYDPMLGRFMGADSILQDPSNLQSHNRHAYTMNNPLKYTDPSGHIVFFDDIILAIATAFSFSGGVSALATTL